MIVHLCTVFHCLPSQLEREDSSILRTLALASLGKATDDE